MTKDSETIVAIDLGTSNSVIAFMDGDKPVSICNQEGALTTPSYVSYQQDGTIVVGQIAKRQAITNYKNTIFSAKRLMGKKYDDLDVVEKNFPYKVIADKNGNAVIKVNGKSITPQEIGAQVIRKLLKSAEDYLGKKIKKAVITTPAWFNSAERERTKEAGLLAGLDEVVRIIAEPTAAALCYGLNNKDKGGLCVVVDCGGATTDISLVDVDKEVLEVISTSGNIHLGGDQVDEIVMKWAVDEFKKNTGINLNDDGMALQRLKEGCEKLKCELSTIQSAELNLPFITANNNGAQHLNFALTRAKFDQMIDGFVSEVLKCCDKALKSGNKSKGEIKEVLLVGGSCRLPLLQTKLKEYFGKELNKSVNFDLAVAEGAAIQGSILAGNSKTDMLLLDINPISVGVETLGNIFTPLVEGGTTIPTKKTQVFSTAADGQTSVEIAVYQGERKFAKDNKLLGRFHLDGIPLMPRGRPQIEVMFDIDANSILSVSAKELSTGKQQTIRIEGSSGLSKDEIEKIRKDAEQYEEEDRKRVEQIGIKNNADNLVYSVEKTLEENDTKLTDDVKADMRVKINELKEELKTDNYDKIKTLHEELMKASYKMSEELYKNVNAEQTQEPNMSSPPPPGDDVIDAEVVE